MTPELVLAALMGHSSLKNALERNRLTGVGRTSGETVPGPPGILTVSAHSYVNAS